MYLVFVKKNQVSQSRHTACYGPWGFPAYFEDGKAQWWCSMPKNEDTSAEVTVPNRYDSIILWLASPRPVTDCQSPFLPLPQGWQTTTFNSWPNTCLHPLSPTPGLDYSHSAPSSPFPGTCPLDIIQLWPTECWTSLTRPMGELLPVQFGFWVLQHSHQWFLPSQPPSAITSNLLDSVPSGPCSLFTTLPLELIGFLLWCGTSFWQPSLPATMKEESLSDWQHWCHFQRHWSYRNS